MNLEQKQRTGASEPVTNQPSQKSSATKPTTERHKTTGSSWLALLGLIVALAALGTSGWVWLSNRHQFNQVAQQMRKHLTETQNTAQSASQMITHVQESMREMTARIIVLEKKVVASQNRQVALQTLVARLSRNRDEWTLTDVEQILLIANEQLTLAGNVNAALTALQTADQRLQATNQPQFVSLRKIIAIDIRRLQAVVPVDITGITIKLNTVASAVATLPLAIHSTLRPSHVPTRKIADSGPWWQRFLRETWYELRQLVRIRNMGKAQVPLLSPPQANALRENVALRLLSARVALLQHDEAAFHGDVAITQQWINRYFDTNAPTTRRILVTLQALEAMPVTVKLPDISASLNAVRHAERVSERAIP